MLTRFPSRLARRVARSRHVGLLAVAAAVGLLAGLAAAGFREAIEAVHRVLWDALPRAAGVGAAAGGWWLLLVIVPPVLGGLLLGPLAVLFPEAARGHGVPEVLEKAVVAGGRIPPRTALIRTIASAITIGSGGSAGREGPIVQIGAAIGSAVGQAFRMSTNRIRVFLGCGAAAGLAAAFDAPIAGAIFALEVILGDFAVVTFSPILIAAAAGTVTSHALHGDRPELAVVTLEVPWIGEFFLFPILGVAAGVLGVAFVKSLRWAERTFERLPVPGWTKPALGGLAVGVAGWAILAAAGDVFRDPTGAALPLPPTGGNGTPAVIDALSGRFGALALASLLVVKIATSSVTLGSGGSGGVFAPLMFVGTMAGGLFGAGVAAVAPHASSPLAMWALVGMAAVAAGATHAPLTMIFILFEMTRGYALVLPLMIACITAAITARRIHPHSIFTAHLAEKGLELRGGVEVRLLQQYRVRELPLYEPRLLSLGARLEEVVAAALESQFRHLPVVDADSRLAGIVSTTDLAALPPLEEIGDLVVASDLMRTDVDAVRLDDTLLTALTIFERRDVDVLPVVDDDDRVVGMITQASVMRLYHRELVRRSLEG